MYYYFMSHYFTIQRLFQLTNKNFCPSLTMYIYPLWMFSNEFAHNYMIQRKLTKIFKEVWTLLNNVNDAINKTSIRSCRSSLTLVSSIESNPLKENKFWCNRFLFRPCYKSSHTVMRMNVIKIKSTTFLLIMRQKVNRFS